MIFTTLDYLFYFPIIVLGYYLSPKKVQNSLLAACNLLLYFNLSPSYLILLVLVMSISYMVGRKMDSTANENKKTIWLRIGICTMLLPLLFFKYLQPIFNYVLTHFNISSADHLGHLNYILPIGISFFTFVAIGYVIDIYNEEIEAEKNFVKVSLLISFFPLILSGPIERAGRLLPQFNVHRPFKLDNFYTGLKWIIWGFFMKLVIADRVGIYIDQVYANLNIHSGNTLFLTALLYPFQVYADLGGYSLIAIGSAKILGIDVVRNFNRPFFATSMAEFWRRWHISLIKWLTDYVYTPLSFSLRKLKQYGVVVSLILTFIISGIWHGAGLTFIVWGILQGILLSIESLTLKFKTTFENKYAWTRSAGYKAILILSTYILFSISQIFGRSNNLQGAASYIHKMLSDRGSFFLDYTTLALSLFGILIVMISEFVQEFYPAKIERIEKKSLLMTSTYLTIFILTLLLGTFKSKSFIYFQF